MNTYLQLIKEKVENIKKQKKIEKEVKNTVKDMLAMTFKNHPKMAFVGQIITKMGGSPLTVYSFAKTAVLAQKEIELRPDFQKWLEKPKRKKIAI